jgi:hypothetical protein
LYALSLFLFGRTSELPRAVNALSIVAKTARSPCKVDCR